MSLKQLLKIYNFRLYRSDCENNKENTNIIRIYLGDGEWFEFGINDWSTDENKMDIIRKVLTKEILKRQVDYFTVDEDVNILVVYLQNESE